MENINSNTYEELGAEFQYQVIKLLNNTLKEYQLSEKNRKHICNQFIYNFSLLHDKGYILGDKKSYNLRFIFEYNEKAIFPNTIFEYHTIANENIYEYFENECESIID